jgi:Spx/MgsR family transcriptional regulator
MITVVGIKSCDTCRKALAWLRAEGLAHQFHDLRADGLKVARAAGWIEACGWEAVLNQRSTTWRSLSDAEKSDLDGTKALALIIKHPTLAKRPIFEQNGRTYVGFTDAVKASLTA